MEVFKIKTGAQLDEFLRQRYGTDKNTVLGILWDSMFGDSLIFYKARAEFYGRLYDHVLKNWK